MVNKNTIINEKVEKLELEIKRIMNRFNDIGKMLKNMYNFDDYICFDDNNRVIIMEYEIDEIKYANYNLMKKPVIPYTFAFYEILGSMIELLEYIHADNIQQLKDQSGISDEIIDIMISRSNIWRD